MEPDRGGLFTPQAGRSVQLRIQLTLWMRVIPREGPSRRQATSNILASWIEILLRVANNKGVYEQVAFSIADSVNRIAEDLKLLPGINRILKRKKFPMVIWATVGLLRKHPQIAAPLRFKGSATIFNEDHWYFEQTVMNSWWPNPVIPFLQEGVTTHWEYQTDSQGRVILCKIPAP